MKLSEAEAIFHQALEVQAGEQRAEFVRRACGQDDELRCKVDRLLRAHETAGGFLQTRTVPITPLSEGPGMQIGKFKILEQIGEGGFGVVYMAEQKEPVRRRVALKIIKLGMDTKQVVARFEAERQALALMDHPNVARVLEGGCTETGRPYFVMELVKGRPITKFCDEERLSTGQRLELFITVCRAVQHAHQKGLVHRDLKPSNVLVSFVDGKAVPKIIDFGIAKATVSGQETVTLRGHGGPVSSVGFSPDGKRLASASWDKTVKVWDATTGKETLTLRGHSFPLFCVVFSSDGKRLASASMDKTVRVWDAESGAALFTLKGHSARVHGVAFSPDCRRLASASMDKMVKLWNATSGEEMLTLKGHSDNVNAVAFSPDGNRLASTSDDGTLKVWDARPRPVR